MDYDGVARRRDRGGILGPKGVDLPEPRPDFEAEESRLSVPPANIEEFRNRPDQLNTIRVESKVVHETDRGEAKGDESRWMRFVLDTVGKTDWTRDRQARPVYPEGFEELSKKLKRPLLPGATCAAL